MSNRLLIAFCLALAAAACEGRTANEDAGGTDAATDAGDADDGGSDAGDAGTPDAGTPDAGNPDAGLDAGPSDGGPDGGLTDAGTADAGACGDAGTLGFGAACTSSCECASRLCFSFGNASSACTLTCSSNAGCPSGSQGQKCNGQGVCKP